MAPRLSRLQTMVTVARIDGIQIVLHFNDHGRPHFHAVTADDRGTIDIETLQLVKGSMPRGKISTGEEMGPIARRRCC